MRFAQSQLKEVIVEETQRVLIEKEFEKYIKESFIKLLTEGKSQKEIEELLAEGLKDTAKRLAMKYGLPLMAVTSILTSTPAFAGAPPEPPSKEVAAATQELPPEEEKSFWAEIGDWLKKHSGDPLRGGMGRTGLKPVAPGQWQQPRDVYSAELDAPQAEKNWDKESEDLLAKHLSPNRRVFIGGKRLMDNFIPSKQMIDMWGKMGKTVPDNIDISGAGTDMAKIKYFVYKSILEPGVKQ